MTTPAPSLLDAALAYAARGWCVIPLHDVTQGHCSCSKATTCGKDAGKHPRIDHWTEAASGDPTQLRTWWQQWPTANVGLLTGARSRLAVLDVDPRNGGDVALEDLEQCYHPLPDTPLVLTGSPGHHYYFRLDGPLRKFNPGPGLNFQADGALVVAPPSLHHSGRHYTWEASSDPDEVPLAPLPDWLRELAQDHTAAQAADVSLPDVLPAVEVATLRVSTRLKYLIRTGEDANDPQRYPTRSEALFAVETGLVGAGYDDATIASVVLDRRSAISAKVWSQKNPRSPLYEAQTRQWLAGDIGRARVWVAAHPGDQEPPEPPDLPDDPRDLEDLLRQAPGAARPRPRTDTAAATRAAAAIFLEATDIMEEDIVWLWEPYVARKKLHALDGDPGAGKTMVACQLAACISRGQALPDQVGRPRVSAGAPARVLLIGMEDGLGDTVIKRLKRAEADLSKITIVNEVDDAGRPRPFLLSDLPMLERHMEDKRPALVYIDSLQAVLGGTVDINRANQVTALLLPLRKFAEAYHAALIFTRHPAKPGQNIAKLIHRGMGSQAFIGAARLGLFVEDYPGDPTKALLVQSKSNAGDMGRTQIFSKRGGMFEWCGVTRITKEMLAGAGKGPTPQAFLETCLWLEARLKDGRSYPAKKLQEEMKEDGLAHGTIFAAKKALGVIHAQTTAGTYTWRLPPLFPLPTPSTLSTSSTPSTPSTPYTSNKPGTCEASPPVSGDAGVDRVDGVYGVDGVVTGTAEPCIHEYVNEAGMCNDCGLPLPGGHP